MRRLPILKTKNKALLAGPFLVWTVAFIAIPLLMVIYYGFTGEDGSFTLENVKRILAPHYLKSLWLALLLSLVSTVACLIMSYPLAMILSKLKGNQSQLIVLIFIIPMWMNFLLRTMAWQTLLEKNGVINTVLHVLHLPSLKIINTPYAIVLGMIYNFLPFMLLPIYNSLIKVDIDVIQAAEDLGANKFQTFTKVILPLTLPGVISGITMVFVPAVSTFVISRMLGGGSNLLIGDLIEMQFLGNSYNLNVGSAMSLVLMIIVLLCMSFTSSFDEDEMEGVS